MGSRAARVPVPGDLFEVNGDPGSFGVGARVGRDEPWILLPPGTILLVTGHVAGLRFSPGGPFVIPPDSIDDYDHPYDHYPCMCNGQLVWIPTIAFHGDMRRINRRCP